MSVCHLSSGLFVFSGRVDSHKGRFHSTMRLFLFRIRYIVLGDRYTMSSSNLAYASYLKDMSRCLCLYPITIHSSSVAAKELNPPSSRGAKSIWV
ncbi:hypothetical protein Thermo_00536 [Thermoplasmatales archaeon]|nr:hypothetical protein Thermo_00536 [Thermoplasmatales archaeon]